MANVPFDLVMNLEHAMWAVLKHDPSGQEVFKIANRLVEKAGEDLEESVVNEDESEAAEEEGQRNFNFNEAMGSLVENSNPKKTDNENKQVANSKIFMTAEDLRILQARAAQGAHQTSPINASSPTIKYQINDLEFKDPDTPSKRKGTASTRKGPAKKPKKA